jgi:hypothetical protein
LIVSFDYTDRTYGLRLGDIDVTKPLETLTASIGGHRVNGILAAAGPDVRQGQPVENVTLYDMMPTILYLLNQPVPEGLDGRVLTELISTEKLTREPIRYVPDTLAGAGPAGSGLEPEEEAAVSERLKGLGYIE